MSSSASQSPILLAAGGTGGHVFPAEALAEELLAQGHRVAFITDKRSMRYYEQGYAGVLAQVPMHTIHAGSLGGSPLQKAKGVAKLFLGVAQAMWLIARIKPRAVVGFGGYPSSPTMVAALLLRVPTIIHEQNSVLGRTNRKLAAHVDVIATSYEKTRFLPESALPKTMRTGNPVRAGIRALAEIDGPQLRPDGILKLLVLGGSQGASIFSDVLPAAMALLPEVARQRIRIDQQCRAGELEATRASYAELGMQVDLAPFFADVPARLASAHLVISRAGAGAVAELAVAGRAAILVPLPSAMDNHQFYNALSVEEAGGGWLMGQEGFTAQSLAAQLETCLTNPQLLNDAALAMRTLGKPGAAAALAALVVGQEPSA
jgi:UDP-N-acetylglucosamine--N-acetylmuramyl-(pentapeptide) pyrophosphoryl-undecaprenol N-acetylglucosamine transferase